MPTANIGKIELYFEEYGSGEPLIMVLGLGQDVATWGFQIKERFTQNYLTRSSPAFERQLKANVGHDTRNRLKDIKAPTLIIAGKDDELTPPKMAEELSSEMSVSELKVFEQGGHGLYWEISELFNESVLDFIKQHGDELP
jgi:pimeloyl-ACP methyl ester carboxylesterase